MSNPEHRFSILQGRAVGDKNLTDPDFRLLAAYGEFGDKDGWCWPSQQALADIVGRSRKWVNERTQVLVELGYLQKEHRFNPDGGQTSNRYRLIFDLPVTSVEEIRTPRVTDDGGIRTPPVPKVEESGYTNVPLNDPLNVNTVTDVPDNLPIEWKIAAGQKVTSLPADNERLKVAEVIAKSFKQDYQLAVDILMAFQNTRNITFLYEEQKKHKAVLKRLIAQNVKPEHVVAAVKKLLSINYTVTSLYSIESVAIDLANPAPVAPGQKKKLQGQYISPKTGL